MIFTARSRSLPSPGGRLGPGPCWTVGCLFISVCSLFFASIWFCVGYAISDVTVCGPVASQLDRPLWIFSDPVIGDLFLMTRRLRLDLRFQLLDREADFAGQCSSELRVDGCYLD